MTRRLPVVTVYLAYMASDGFLFHVMSVIFSVFLILRLGLGPFQLVVMGTILEGSYLLFETPTGVVADTISRRTSVIIGLAGGGVGFLILGFSHNFWMAAASQVVWGIFATFQSGADVAWLTDEVGEEAARSLYIRGDQFAHAASVAGIIVGVALGTVNLALPIVVSGVGLLFLAIWLWIVMPEDNFQKRARMEGERLHRSLIETFKEAMRAVRAHHVLMLILGTAALHGASTEGFDRLADLHLLRDIGLPSIGNLSRLWWFAILDGGALLIGFGLARDPAQASEPRGPCRGRAHPRRDRRATRSERGRVRPDGSVLGGHRGRMDRRRPSQRARSGVHGVDQPRARSEDPGDDQLHRRTGRRGRAGRRGTRTGRHRRWYRRPVRDRGLRTHPASRALAVPSRDQEGVGGHAGAGTDRADAPA